MGVQYVLEGSVQRSGDRLRITAQLIDALKNHHLWSERYDQEMRDIFAIQDKITVEILKALDVRLSAGERARMWGKGTDSLEAYVKFLESRELIAERNKDSNIKARPIAEEVIRLDPKYPTGYYTLAILNMMDVVLGISKSPRDSLTKAIELCRVAIALDDSHAASHALLGFLYVQIREHDKGLVQAERAVEMAPHSSDAHSWFAQVLNFSRRAQEAAMHMDKAFRLNPVAPPAWYYAHAVHAYRLLGRHEDALRLSKEILRRSPKDIGGNLGLIMGYVALGRDDEARDAAREFLRMDPKFSAEKHVRSLPYKDPVQTTQVLELLRKAGLPD
jgi:adenylate cyclase